MRTWPLRCILCSGSCKLSRKNKEVFSEAVAHLDSAEEILTKARLYGESYAALCPMGFRPDLFSSLADAAIAECVKLDAGLHKRLVFGHFNMSCLPFLMNHRAILVFMNFDDNITERVQMRDAPSLVTAHWSHLFGCQRRVLPEGTIPKTIVPASTRRYQAAIYGCVENSVDCRRVISSGLQESLFVFYSQLYVIDSVRSR